MSCLSTERSLEIRARSWHSWARASDSECDRPLEHQRAPSKVLYPSGASSRTTSTSLPGLRSGQLAAQAQRRTLDRLSNQRFRALHKKVVIPQTANKYGARSPPNHENSNIRIKCRCARNAAVSLSSYCGDSKPTANFAAEIQSACSVAKRLREHEYSSEDLPGEK